MIRRLLISFSPPFKPQLCRRWLSKRKCRGRAAHLPPTVHWHVYIGNSSTGSGVLLEDDGRTTRYQSGEYSRIIANYTLHEDEMTLIVQPAVVPTMTWWGSDQVEDR